jgi:hypothetical protein
MDAQLRRLKAIKQGGPRSASEDAPPTVDPLTPKKP